MLIGESGTQPLSQVSVKRAISASTLFKVWAISSILGAKDIVLDKKIDGTKWGLPRELVVTLLTSDLDGVEEVWFWIFDKFPWFTESCFPLALRQPKSNWFRLEITVGIRLTLWSACILRWIPPRVPLVGFKIPASLQAVHSEFRKGLMSCVGFFHQNMRESSVHRL